MDRTLCPSHDYFVRTTTDNGRKMSDARPLFRGLHRRNSVSSLGFQTNRVQVYLALPLQPGQSQVCSSAATECTSAYDQGVVNILRLPDVYCIPNRVTCDPVFFILTVQVPPPPPPPPTGSLTRLNHLWTRH